ncbi:MAG TPA: hypothetical protein VHP99_18420 [Pyrinomonadaceae bacterium]|nr:hypothetical protein [Pyrinomonadaceae bacterium]
MASDPGLAGDTCIFMEAIPADGGIHNPNGVWWLSPDITLTGHTSGLETADQGLNKIAIRFHRKPAGNCTFPGDESITVQAWVANPSLVMSPHVHGSAARVGFIGSPVPAEGSAQTQQIDWTPPAVNVPAPLVIDSPQKPGPKCLVALCYPDSLVPSATSFFVPGDQHVAQHNLCIIVTHEKSVTFNVNSFNLAASSFPSIQPVKLRGVLDLAPSTFVKKMVLSRVQALPGFHQLRTAGLTEGFAFDLTGLQASHIVDHTTGPFTPPHLPSYEVSVHLSGSLTKLKFRASVKDAHPGEVCIYHLTQTFNDHPQGGLTLAVLKT